MTARPQDVALLPLPMFDHHLPVGDGGPDTPMWSANKMRVYALEVATAALASAQAREDELRATNAGLLESCRERQETILTLTRIGMAAEARAERLDEALRKIATVAHAGGSVGMSEADALTAIRKLTLKHWDRNAEPKHVRAALSTNAATQTGETNEAAE